MNGDSNLSTQESDVDRRVRRVELTISYSLRAGVLASLTLIVGGTVLSFVHHSEYVRSAADLGRLTQPGAAFPHAWRDVVAGLRDFRGQAVVTLGLLILVATPVVRVAISILAFYHQGDRVYTLITTAVLCLLVLSFILGTVE